MVPQIQAGQGGSPVLRSQLCSNSTH